MASSPDARRACSTCGSRKRRPGRPFEARLQPASSPELGDRWLVASRHWALTADAETQQATDLSSRKRRPGRPFEARLQPASSPELGDRWLVASRHWALTADAETQQATDL